MDGGDGFPPSALPPCELRNNGSLLPCPPALFLTRIPSLSSLFWRAVPTFSRGLLLLRTSPRSHRPSKGPTLAQRRCERAASVGVPHLLNQGLKEREREREGERGEGERERGGERGGGGGFPLGPQKSSLPAFSEGAFPLSASASIQHHSCTCIHAYSNTYRALLDRIELFSTFSSSPTRSPRFPPTQNRGNRE